MLPSRYTANAPTSNAQPKPKLALTRPSPLLVYPTENDLFCGLCCFFYQLVWYTANTFFHYFHYISISQLHSYNRSLNATEFVIILTNGYISLTHRCTYSSKCLHSAIIALGVTKLIPLWKALLCDIDRGHSTTTETEFSPFLTTHLPLVKNLSKVKEAI